jgi:hypothetical protein
MFVSLALLDVPMVSGNVVFLTAKSTRGKLVPRKQGSVGGGRYLAGNAALESAGNPD